LASRIPVAVPEKLLATGRRVFGHPVVLLETFVDPQRFHGTVYKASNWLYVGEDQRLSKDSPGVQRHGAVSQNGFPQPLQKQCRAVLSRAILDPPYRTGGHKIMLSAQQIGILTPFLSPDPRSRRGQGRRHPLCTVLAIAAGHPVRDAEVPGHLGLAKKLGPRHGSASTAAAKRPLPLPVLGMSSADVLSA